KHCLRAGESCRHRPSRQRGLRADRTKAGGWVCFQQAGGAVGEKVVGSQERAMKRILVVDDNEMLCRLACDILSSEGYHAVPASSADQALEAFEREEFDLLVTDFRMPGMSGLELARAIRNRNPQFPIIIMSAYEPVECEHVTLWLPKQYLFPGLVEKIQYCLSASEVGSLAK